MNALEAGFGFTITDCERSLSLREGEHIRMYPTGNNEGFGEELTKRQVDLVHVADGWVRRQAILNGVRSPVLDIEVLDAPFWSQPGTMTLLKACVDFLSGGDDWNFRFLTVTSSRHQRRNDLFRGYDLSAITSLYSGGLDSAAGLAARLAMEPGRMMIPVTVRHQMQKAKLVGEHFRMLLEKRLVKREDLKPFQAGAFVRNVRIKHEFGEKFREITHRCRPMLFMVVAGLVADSFSTHEVEVYESGVGSINLPLGNGPADFRTTRSTHPHFLRLMGALVSHVNDSEMRYVLPFADHTKAEMVARLKKQGLEALARGSISPKRLAAMRALPGVRVP
jgi:7-cyano-7-deazaguanine synthase in queuosine biosynthesis